MSIIVAVHKNDSTVLAADTLTTFGDDRRMPAANSTTSKIRRISDSGVGAAGWAVYDRVLDDFLVGRPEPDLTSEQAIFAFFVELWGALHERYSFVNDQAQAKDSPFGDLDSTFLIANRTGIFKVSNDMDVCRFEQYYAIGSGADYALGALHNLYDRDASAEATAIAAVRTACEFDVYCDGETSVMTL